MAITATAKITNNLNFTLNQQGDNRQSETASLNSSVDLIDGPGTGNFEINYGVMKSGYLETGNTVIFDFRNISKNIFDIISTISFTGIKSIIIENRSTGVDWDLDLHATGANGLSGMFNGGSGDLKIKPYGVWTYSDVMSGENIGNGNKELTIENNNGMTGVDWTMVVVGVTG